MTNEVKRITIIFKDDLNPNPLPGLGIENNVGEFYLYEGELREVIESFHIYQTKSTYLNDTTFLLSRDNTIPRNNGLAIKISWIKDIIVLK